MSDSQFPISEQDVLALKAGDQRVLRKIFFEMQPRVYRFLWLKTRSVEISEDLVQQTFMRLWDARKKLRATSNLETYIFRIASNLATDELRRSDRQKEVHLEVTEPVAATSADSEVRYNQLAQAVDRIVSTLPDAPRTAFLLSRYEGLSHKEIAEVMNISIKTAEKHISKALQVLKEGLKDFDPASPG